MPPARRNPNQQVTAGLPPLRIRTVLHDNPVPKLVDNYAPTLCFVKEFITNDVKCCAVTRLMRVRIWIAFTNISTVIPDLIRDPENKRIV